MKKAMLAMSALALTGGDDPSEEKAADGCNGGSSGPRKVVIQYKEHPLDSISWAGSHREIGYTCDWDNT